MTNIWGLEQKVKSLRRDAKLRNMRIKGTWRENKIAALKSQINKQQQRRNKNDKLRNMPKGN